MNCQKCSFLPSSFLDCVRQFHKSIHTPKKKKTGVNDQLLPSCHRNGCVRHIWISLLSGTRIEHFNISCNHVIAIQVQWNHYVTGLMCAYVWNRWSAISMTTIGNPLTPFSSRQLVIDNEKINMSQRSTRIFSYWTKAHESIDWMSIASENLLLDIKCSFSGISYNKQTCTVDFGWIFFWRVICVYAHMNGVHFRLSQLDTNCLQINTHTEIHTFATEHIRKYDAVLIERIGSAEHMVHCWYCIRMCVCVCERARMYGTLARKVE